ncbi:MAG: threonine synthase [Bacteroidales bacterium]|nr:threonine synthase [Bacteroidales bacterium]MCQ2215631.1 threonine synthase [Bacteroidales bacterium]
MKFYSTNNKEHWSDLKSAVLKGLAPDKGLYMPESIPVLPQSFWDWLPGKSMGEIGFEVLKHFFCPDIPEDKFKAMVEDAFNFPVPVVEVKKGVYSLELFHGPTLAFKDVGARFLARVMAYFADFGGRPINVLAATSGDTGSAVANGFLGVKNVYVHVLYPSGLVSEIQEKQFTTLGQNVTAYEVAGVFDDCQRMVKQAFMDPKMSTEHVLTSANSINLARFLPQSVYYFHALAQMPKEDWGKLVICVPSGNFGDITAGLIAWKMGMPVKRFIAAVNANKVFPEFLQSGKYNPQPSIATIANAMDVGDPSNFARVFELFNGSVEEMKKLISSRSYSDEQIGATMKKVSAETGYTCDPHGAVGYAALEDELKGDEIGIFLETAHPAKFKATVEKYIGKEVEIPARLQKFMDGEKKSIAIKADFNLLQVK